MNMNRNLHWIAILSVALSCTDKGVQQTLTYRIENTTDRQVSLLFYNFDAEGNRILSYSEEIDGPGAVIERDLDVGISAPENPTLAFRALLVDVIFDNKRIEEHYNLEPSGRSIVDQGAYVNQNDALTYSINLENFENAVPCNGPCN